MRNGFMRGVLRSKAASPLLNMAGLADFAPDELMDPANALRLRLDMRCWEFAVWGQSRLCDVTSFFKSNAICALVLVSVFAASGHAVGANAGLRGVGGSGEPVGAVVHSSPWRACTGLASGLVAL